MKISLFIFTTAIFSTLGFFLAKCLKTPTVRLTFAFLFGFSSTLTIEAMITAIGFIPDDWSANRLTWAGGLFYGYHLYPGDSGPSNGFFYPPAGAWFYLPAAGLGILCHSPSAALILGWLMSIACIFSPMIFLLCLIIKKENKPALYYYLTFLISACIVFACPQLRYVATMIHVDSPALLFLGLSLVLILPMDDFKTAPSYQKSIASAFFLTLSAFTKQSTWPLIPLMLVTGFHFYNRKYLVIFISSMIVTSVFIIGVLRSFENLCEVYRMVWVIPSHQLVVTSARFALQQFFSSNLPIFCQMILMFVGLRLRKIKISSQSYQSIMLFFIMALWMIPFSILTRMRMGADWNHLALPSYLALLGCMILLPSLLDYLFNLTNTFHLTLISIGIAVMLSFSINPYLLQSCGWYLWLHNPHEQALRSSDQHPSETYFPWQAFSMLLSEHKLYHLDDCLRYESSAGWKRSSTCLNQFLPPRHFKIALRPFGAPSYLVEIRHYHETYADPSLGGWKIYQE